MRYTLLFILTLATGGILYSQNTVSFRISEESGAPLIGATIVIEGTNTGTITNEKGIALFDNLPVGSVKFEISFIGYEAYKMSLRFPDDNNKTFEVILKEGEEELEEIIISATRSASSGSTQRRKNTWLQIRSRLCLLRAISRWT